MSNKKPTVEAGRRRPGGSSKPTGRADAPRRRRPETGGGGGLPPPSGGGGPAGPSGQGSQFGGLPGGLPRNLGVGCILVLLVGFFLLQMVLGGGDQGADLPESGIGQPDDLFQPTQPPAAQPAIVPTRPIPTRAPASASRGDTWLVMLYQDADDKILEQDIYLDLNEAERVGSSDNVQIVAQIDRYRGGFQGDGDWDSTRRYYVRQDDDLTRVNSDLLEDLGEANMADGQTLVEFVTWAIENFPSDKYALILSDHGMGWPGGWSDPTSRSSGGNFPLASAMGDQIYLHELDQALEDIRSQTGLDKLELIGMDACLMGHLEVLSSLTEHARYAITSQETEPALGWAYTAFLNELTANPGMDGAALGEVIVNTYIQDDQRIVDDQLRAEMFGRGSLLGSLFGAPSVPSASDVSNQMVQNATLAAVDLSVLPELVESFNQLTYTLQDADQQDIAQARTHAQSFTSIFGQQAPPSYIDLGHFAQLAGRIGGQRSVGEASNRLLEVLSRAVIAERHGTKKPGATGISIYFPNSALYRSPEAGPSSYTVTAERFASESLWDEFLAFHYTGRSFEQDERVVTVPDSSAAIEAPAAGGIQVAPIQASATTVEPGDSIRLTTDISGAANIGYVRLLVGFLDQANNSIYTIDSDYLESPEIQELNGVYYPVWGAEEFTLAFTWEPIVFAINDGETTAVALLNPESYGATPEEAVYSVDGVYTYAADGEQRYARLYMSDGQLRQVYGFREDNGTGAPWEVTPSRGDTFTVLEKWMDLDAQGNVVQVAQQTGETLTFGDEMFTWEQLYAAAGQYSVGFVVEDLDGNSQTTFIQVTVR